MPLTLPSFIRRRLPAIAAAILVLGLSASGALAHEGHDAGPVVTSASAVPGLIVRNAASDRFELVCKYQEPVPGVATPVRFYLSDPETNAPIAGATLQLSGSADAASVRGTATTIAPGIYQATLIFPVKGSYVMRVTIQGAGPTANLALSDLDVGFQSATPAAAGKPNRLLVFGLIALAVVVLGLAVLVRRRPGRPAVLALVLALCAGSLMAFVSPAVVRAHEGHDQGPAPAGAGGFRYVAKQSQFLLGLRTASATTQVLHARVSALGHVVPESGATATVAAPQSGRLESAGKMPATGDQVRKGQILAYVTVIDRLPIRSPLAGTVSEVKFTAGQWVQAGQELASVVDESRVRVEAPLFGENLTRALTARTAVVTSAALPGRTFPAKVLGTAPFVSESSTSHAVPVVLAVANGSRLLRPGMLVQANLLLPTSAPAVVIPQSAIVRVESGPVVFVHTAPEIFEFRPVQLGESYGSDVAVLQGVRPGERVVMAGAYSIVAAPSAPAAAAKWGRP